VAGVRYSDAEAFCAWLDARAQGRHWLPVADESALPPLAKSRDEETRVGYWVRDDPQGDRGQALRGAQAPQIQLAALKARLDDDRARGRDLACALTLGLAHADARAIVLELKADSIHPDTFKRAIDLERDLRRARDFARTDALEREIVRIRKRAFELERALALARTSELDRDLELARAIADGLARDLEPDRVRDLGHIRVQDLDSEFGLKLDPHSWLDRTRTIDLARGLATGFDFDLDLIAALERARKGTCDLQRARARIRELGFSHAIADALDAALGRASDRGLAHDRTLERASARANALFLACMLYAARSETARSIADRLGLGRNAVSIIAGRSRVADVCLGLYIDLCILEERIEGALPAVEGIRIVRERRGAESS
jgi:hypothetical protein